MKLLRNICGKRLWHLDRGLVGLLLAGLLAGPLQAKYGGGRGTPDDPYLIHTAEQMNTIGLRPEDWDKHFKLMADLDLAAYEGDSFNLIGLYMPPSEGGASHPFTGVFDGNGHTISHFTYLVDASRPSPLPGLSRSHIGLFREVTAPGQIKNLGLLDSSIEPATSGTVSVSRVGTLVGWLNEGSIVNCHIEGGWVAADSYVGGLVGQSTRGMISGSHAACNVAWAMEEVSRPGLDATTFFTCFGGLVGSNSGEIHDSYATGTVRGAGQSVGGLAGRNVGGRYEAIGLISNCFATGSVSGDEIVGGLVGTNDAGTIQHSCATGDVSGNKLVGGLAGSHTGQRPRGDINGKILPGESWFFALMKDCYATGTVRDSAPPETGANWKGTGGLIGKLTGYGNRVINCYATGAVSGQQEFVGGLVGSGTSGVSKSFWDTETSGCPDGPFGTGKTTAEMQDPATYLLAGWDFVGETANGTEEIWTIDGNEPGYPRLTWEQTLSRGLLDPDGAATGEPVTIYETTLDTDPGWTTEGQWQFGPPAGRGGAHGYPDPDSGRTGTNVYGVNLDGDYDIVVDGPHYLTAGPFDCRRYRQVKLQFARWLNTDQADFVGATLEVSHDAVQWTTVWTYSDTEAELTEDAWSTMIYDISDLAGARREVYLRWGYEVYDAQAWAFAGWNIDDIILTGR